MNFPWQRQQDGKSQQAGSALWTRVSGRLWLRCNVLANSFNNCPSAVPGLWEAIHSNVKAVHLQRESRTFPR